MLRRSTLLILLPAFALAALGWFGRTPLLPVTAGAALVQRRAAWQPSPIPTNWAAPVLPTRTPTPASGASVSTPTSAPAGTSTPAPVATSTLARTQTPGSTPAPAISGTATPPRPTVVGTSTAAGAATAQSTA